MSPHLILPLLLMVSAAGCSTLPTQKFCRDGVCANEKPRSPSIPN
jgi:hypothetical protein